MGDIVWLASYPKSGNTWLRAFLHNLLRNPSAPVDIDSLNQFCLGDTDAEYFARLTDTPYEKLTKAEQAELRPRVHQTLVGASPDTVFVKTHHFLGEDCGVPLISMAHTAGAFYVVRNPLDIAISASHHYGRTLDQAIAFLADDNAHAGGGGGHVHQVITSWSNHVRSWTQRPNPGLHVVRYEDMLAKPRPTFAGIARFLGLKPPRDRLQRAIRFSSFKVLRGQEDRHGFRENVSTTSDRFFRQGTAGQWRHALTPEQVARVVDAHREQMQRFGYLPSGD